MLKLNEELVTYLYPEQSTKPYFREMSRFLTSDVVVGLEVVGDNVIERCTLLGGHINP